MGICSWGQFAHVIEPICHQHGSEILFAVNIRHHWPRAIGPIFSGRNMGIRLGCAERVSKECVQRAYAETAHRVGVQRRYEERVTEGMRRHGAQTRGAEGAYR